MLSDTITARVDDCSESSLAFHRAHKERLHRIAARAVVPIAPPMPPKEDKPAARIVSAFSGGEILDEEKIREINAGVRAVRPLSIATIQVEVCKARNISRASMLCKRRTAPLTFSRHIAMYLSRHLTPLSLPEIGRRFGGRDHTTVLHAVNRISQMMREDSVLADEIGQMKASILAERAAQ